MSRVWLIADLHFGHTNVIKYSNRPFQNREEMDQFMIEKWNSVVAKDDKVFVLGDFSFYGKEKTEQIMKTLKGNKILILGNHDKGHGMNWWKEVGFKEVYKYPIVYREFLILSHEPVFMNDHMPYLNIHGHLHENKIDALYYYSVSVENIEYTPINIENIINFHRKLKEYED